MSQKKIHWLWKFCFDYALQSFCWLHLSYERQVHKPKLNHTGFVLLSCLPWVSLIDTCTMMTCIIDYSPQKYIYLPTKYEESFISFVVCYILIYLKGWSIIDRANSLKEYELNHFNDEHKISITSTKICCGIFILAKKYKITKSMATDLIAIAL